MERPVSSELDMMSFVLSSARTLHHLLVFCLVYILLISTLPLISCDVVAASSEPAGPVVLKVNALPKQVESRRQSSMRTAAVITKSDTDTELTGLEADSSCSLPKEGYSITTRTQTTTTKTIVVATPAAAAAAATIGSSTAAAIGELQETGAETVMELSSGGLQGRSSKSSIELSPSPAEPLMVPPSKAIRTRFKSRRMLAPNRVCTNKDISIFQGQDGSSGIPQYIVQIVNTCLSNCAPSDIHVYCGWFASALLVNPNIFTRIAFNDCLVNGGRPLRPGDIIRFEYANSFMYPIRFKSASFC